MKLWPIMEKVEIDSIWWRPTRRMIWLGQMISMSTPNKFQLDGTISRDRRE